VKTKVIVVTNAHGDVVATHQAFDAPPGIAMVRAVPVGDQSIHELMIDKPQRFEKPEDVDKFHASLRPPVRKTGRTQAR
jgi:hypothetical protein